MENQSENNDIDDVIIPTAPLYKQILNLYAEENAIEDTIFYLGEALRRGVIDLEVFLKVCSSLYFFLFFLREQKFCHLLSCIWLFLVMLCLTSPLRPIFVLSMCVCCHENSSSCERSCRKHGRPLDLVTFTDPAATNTFSSRHSSSDHMTQTLIWSLCGMSVGVHQWYFTSVQNLATVHHPCFIFLIWKKQNEIRYDIWTLEGKN